MLRTSLFMGFAHFHSGFIQGSFKVYSGSIQGFYYLTLRLNALLSLLYRHKSIENHKLMDNYYPLVGKNRAFYKTTKTA